MANAGFTNRPDLVQYVSDLFGTFGSANRGQVILNLGEKLLSLTSDATYGTTATAFSAAVSSNLSYAQNPTNNTPGDRTTTFPSPTLAPTPAPDPAPAPAVAATYTLTTGVDNFVGDAANDTFIGNSTTFGATDVVNGGGGTDTFNFTSNSDAAPLGQTSNIEAINITNVGGSPNYNARIFSGATNINAFQSELAVTIRQFAAGQQVGLVGIPGARTGGLSAFYDSLVTSATVNVSGNILDSSLVRFATPMTINGNGLTSVTINNTGGSNTFFYIIFSGQAVTNLTLNVAIGSSFAFDKDFYSFDRLAANAAITVNGAGSANIGMIIDNVATVSAASSSGGVTVQLNTRTTNLTVVGGSGNDVITTRATLAAGSSVDAGTGTADRLVIANTTHLTAGSAAFYRGFEQLSVADGVTADASLLAANNTIDTIIIADGTAAGGTAVTGLTAAQADKVQIVSANATGAITIAVAGAATAGQVDTVRAALTTTTAAGLPNNIDLTGLTLTNVEKLILTGNGANAVTAGTISLTTTNATALNEITVTSAGSSRITVANTHAAANLLIDGSASSGNLTVLAYDSNGTNTELRGNSGNDTLLGSIRADVIKGGAGNDIITGATGVTVAGGTFTAITTGSLAADVLTGDAGNDIFGFGVGTLVANMSSITDLNLGGSTASGRVDTIVFDLATNSGATAVTIVPLSTAQQGAVTGAATLTAAANAALTAAGGVNNVATFTYGTDTYLVINGDGNATFDAAQDVVVRITGLTGTLDASDITIV